MSAVSAIKDAIQAALTPAIAQGVAGAVGDSDHDRVTVVVPVVVVTVNSVLALNDQEMKSER